MLKIYSTNGTFLEHLLVPVCGLVLALSYFVWQVWPWFMIFTKWHRWQNGMFRCILNHIKGTWADIMHHGTCFVGLYTWNRVDKRRKGLTSVSFFVLTHWSWMVPSRLGKNSFLVRASNAENVPIRGLIFFLTWALLCGLPNHVLSSFDWSYIWTHKCCLLWRCRHVQRLTHE